MSASVKTYTPAKWTRLDWDSEQFGFPAARLTVNEPLAKPSLAEVLDECRTEGIRHLVARVDAADLSSVHVLEHAGFELLDGIQTFALRLGGGWHVSGEDGLTVRLFQPSDRAQVLAIARTAYVYDRFHADSALTREVADRVNETWVDNSCRSAIGSAVFVAEEMSSILGFVTCKLDAGRQTGIIDMVATRESARRRGVATAITAASLRWFAGNAAATVEVGTQLTNFAAASLYQKFGFRPVAVKLTFRKLL